MCQDKEAESPSKLLGLFHSMFELQVPDLLTEPEKDVFWTSYPAGFPSFLGRFLLVKVGCYFNEIDEEWREGWMYTDGEEYLLDTDVNMIYPFQAGERVSEPERV